MKNYSNKIEKDDADICFLTKNSYERQSERVCNMHEGKDKEVFMFYLHVFG